MDIKKKRRLILDAAENSINELIKVMDKKMDLEEVDPEKVKISASAYRLAMEDAIALLDRVEQISSTINEKTKSKTDTFFGAEGRAK